VPEDETQFDPPDITVSEETWLNMVTVGSRVQLSTFGRADIALESTIIEVVLLGRCTLKNPLIGSEGPIL